MLLDIDCSEHLELALSQSKALRWYGLSCFIHQASLNKAGYEEMNLYLGGCMASLYGMDTMS